MTLRLVAWIDGLRQDVRHAFRTLRRTPGLVVVSALSLGLGIGLNAILYMGVTTVYRHEPTMVEAERMVGVEPGNANQFSYPDYQDLARSSIFAGAIGFRTTALNLTTREGVVPVGALAVTGNFFEVLGVTAHRGRTFSGIEAAAEREPRVVVVTDGFWRSRLGADPAAIGEPLILNGQPFTVIGVLPERYRAVTGWMAPGLYVPIGRTILPTLDERGSPSVTVMARLARDRTAADAQKAVTAFGASLERTYPERAAGMTRPASVFPASATQFRGTPRQFFLVAGLLWASVVLVLIIACVNVTGLLMARAVQRRRELTIRVAIGAGRMRVVQAMLVESFLLVLAGAAIGLPLALASNRVAWPDVLAPLQNTMTVDGRLLSYALALIALTTVLCGVLPALRATRGDGLAEVRQSGDGTTLRLGVRQALVVGQVAMSLTLIVLAFLCIRSQQYVGRADLGFDIDHGVVARFSFDARQYPSQERVRFADRLVRQLEGTPGVVSVSVSNLVPLGGDSLVRSFHPAGRTDIPGTRPSTYSVGPRYFQSLAIPFVRGRDFDAADADGAARVAIVNETFARTHFPGEDALGRLVQTAGEADAEVIGIVRDNRIGTIGESPQSVVYYPFAQRPDRLIVHMRTSVPPDALVATLARAVETVAPNVPVSVQTLRNATSLELTMRRAGTVLMGTIGTIGLLLAMIGIYGVMAYLAAARRMEIGIRMALGATGRRIGWETLQRVLTLVATGVTIGGIAALAMTPALRTFLIGISPFDPVAFVTSAALLAIVGLAAGVVPAYRTSKVDPVNALRRP